MEPIIDFMLLAASAAATFYCIVLNRKLDQLKSTEKGLGATIATMSQIVEQARAAVEFAKESGQENVAALSPLVAETREMLPRLNELIDVVSELTEISIDEINEAAADASKQLSLVVEAARKVATAIKESSVSVPSAKLHHEGVNGQPATVYLDDAPQAAAMSARLNAAIKSARTNRSMKQTAGRHLAGSE